MTFIQEMGTYENNHLYIMREDLIPFSFGGNKARKAQLFFSEIDQGDFDCVVTYGSGSSNLCRVVANECCRRDMDCYIVSPEEAFEDTFNRDLMALFGARVKTVPVSEVHDTIENVLAELRGEGKKPYFIAGGGHGDIGTEAYVNCYKEIKEFEESQGIFFDYIFHASGTGTTQAGLICGKILSGDERNIIGISIARKNPRGREIVMESVRNYLGDSIQEKTIDDNTVFIDCYTSGYGEQDRRVDETIVEVIKKYGIPLDKTYTGKAFMGMKEYLSNITDKNVLFIHTGGTPLFFDALRSGL